MSSTWSSKTWTSCTAYPRGSCSVVITVRHQWSECSLHMAPLHSKTISGARRIPGLKYLEKHGVRVYWGSWDNRYPHTSSSHVTASVNILCHKSFKKYIYTIPFFVPARVYMNIYLFLIDETHILNYYLFYLFRKLYTGDPVSGPLQPPVD